MNIRKLLSKENFIDIIQLVEEKRIYLFRSLEEYGINFTTKTKSELISQLFESSLYEYFQGKGVNTERAGSDSLKPDILFTDTNTPLEIKTTKGDYWIGGSYSKRSGDFLLVSWDDEDQIPVYFISHVKLEKKDWATEGENFYGTKFKKKELMNNKTAIILMGDLIEQNRGIKMIKQSIKDVMNNYETV